MLVVNHLLTTRRLKIILLLLGCCASTTAPVLHTIIHKMTTNDSEKKHSKTRYNRFSILTIVLVIIKAVPFSGGENLCNAPKVVKGSAAKITCSFAKNVPRMQENLSLEHLALSAIDHEIVVSCQVIQGRYVCTSNDGYQVVGNITDVLVVEIREALPEHAGNYWCGGFKSNPLARSHCRLNVTDDLNLNLETTSVPSAKVLLADKQDDLNLNLETTTVPNAKVLLADKQDDLNLNLETTTVPNAKVLLSENDDKQEKIKEDIMTTLTNPIVLVVIIATAIIFTLAIIVIIIRHHRKRKHIDKKTSSEEKLILDV